MKKRIRQEMRAVLAAMSPQDISVRSERACDRLGELPEFKKARTLMLFLDIPDEIDARPLARKAWAQSKTVLTPRVIWESRQMSPIEITSLDSGLARNAYGLNEPVGGRCWPDEDIDLIVVPGLAFDRSGNRLGRGGGFYDRFLSQPRIRAVLCGLGFGEQVVDEVPVHSNDYPVDILVTDCEVLRFNHRPREGKANCLQEE